MIATHDAYEYEWCTLSSTQNGVNSLSDCQKCAAYDMSDRHQCEKMVKICNEMKRGGVTAGYRSHSNENAQWRRD